MAPPSTPALASSRKVTFKLQFVDSEGIRWGSVKNTIDYVDILLQRHLKEVLKQSSEDVEGPSRAILEKTVVVDVNSKAKGG